MTLVSQMRGTPPTHVVRMRTAPTVGTKPPLLSRPRVTAGLAVGLRARVLPTVKFPPLASLREFHRKKTKRKENTTKTKEEGKTSRSTLVIPAGWVIRPEGHCQIWDDLATLEFRIVAPSRKSRP